VKPILVLLATLLTIGLEAAPGSVVVIDCS
jgi:hypothetical protein